MFARVFKFLLRPVKLTWKQQLVVLSVCVALFVVVLVFHRYLPLWWPRVLAPVIVLGANLCLSNWLYSPFLDQPAPVRKTCGECGYDLAGLTPGSACPECGFQQSRIVVRYDKKP